MNKEFLRQQLMTLSKSNLIKLDMYFNIQNLSDKKTLVNSLLQPKIQSGGMKIRDLIISSLLTSIQIEKAAGLGLGALQRSLNPTKPKKIEVKMPCRGLDCYKGIISDKPPTAEQIATFQYDRAKTIAENIVANKMKEFAKRKGIHEDDEEMKIPFDRELFEGLMTDLQNGNLSYIDDLQNGTITKEQFLENTRKAAVIKLQKEVKYLPDGSVKWGKQLPLFTSANPTATIHDYNGTKPLEIDYSATGRAEPATSDYQYHTSPPMTKKEYDHYTQSIMDSIRPNITITLDDLKIMVSENIDLDTKSKQDIHQLLETLLQTTLSSREIELSPEMNATLANYEINLSDPSKNKSELAKQLLSDIQQDIRNSTNIDIIHGQLKNVTIEIETLKKQRAKSERETRQVINDKISNLQIILDTSPVQMIEQQVSNILEEYKYVINIYLAIKHPLFEVEKNKSELGIDHDIISLDELNINTILNTTKLIGYDLDSKKGIIHLNDLVNQERRKGSSNLYKRYRSNMAKIKFDQDPKIPSLTDDELTNLRSIFHDPSPPSGTRSAQPKASAWATCKTYMQPGKIDECELMAIKYARQLYGLSSTASADLTEIPDIDQKHRLYSLQYHPDKHPGKQNTYSRIFNIYHRAYQILKYEQSTKTVPETVPDTSQTVTEEQDETKRDDEFEEEGDDEESILRETWELEFAKDHGPYSLDKLKAEQKKQEWLNHRLANYQHIKDLIIDIDSIEPLLNILRAGRSVKVAREENIKIAELLIQDPRINIHRNFEFIMLHQRITGEQAMVIMDNYIQLIDDYAFFISINKFFFSPVPHIEDLNQVAVYKLEQIGDKILTVKIKKLQSEYSLLLEKHKTILDKNIVEQAKEITDPTDLDILARIEEADDIVFDRSRTL